MNRRELLKLGTAMAVAPGLPAKPVVRPGLMTWSSGWIALPALTRIRVNNGPWKQLNEATGLWEDV